MHHDDAQEIPIGIRVQVMTKKGPALPTMASDLDFLLMANSWQTHADTYKLAADELVKTATADPASVIRGDFILPIAFLYRHYLELMLKSLLHGGMSLGKVSPPNDVLEGHNLHKLWNETDKLLALMCTSADDAQIKAAQRLILEYHSVDKTSCAFRYPHKTDGTRFLRALPTSGRLPGQLRSLNVSGPRDDIASVHDFLDLIANTLNAEFDGYLEDNAL
jgi:hypothetical protein